MRIDDERQGLGKILPKHESRGQGQVSAEWQAVACRGQIARFGTVDRDRKHVEVHGTDSRLYSISAMRQAVTASVRWSMLPLSRDLMSQYFHHSSQQWPVVIPFIAQLDPRLNIKR
jgi:hypothetical protein